LTPKCFLTILGATVSTPRLVANHLPLFSISFICESFFIKSGEDATAERVICVVPTKFAPTFFNPLHTSIIASAFGKKSLLSHPYNNISSD
jgi:hypothetical protein